MASKITWAILWEQWGVVERGAFLLVAVLPCLAASHVGKLSLKSDSYKTDFFKDPQWLIWTGHAAGFDDLGEHSQNRED